MGFSIIILAGLAIALTKTNAMNATQLSPEYDQALQIVRNILGKVLSPDRISAIPNKCYFPIVLDGRPHRTICRIYRTPHLYLGTISSRKVETRVRIRDASEIGNYANELYEVVRKYNGTL